MPVVVQSGQACPVSASSVEPFSVYCRKESKDIGMILDVWNRCNQAL